MSLKLGTDSASSPASLRGLRIPAAVPHCGSCKCLALGQLWPLIRLPVRVIGRMAASTTQVGRKGNSFEASVGLG